MVCLVSVLCVVFVCWCSGGVYASCSCQLCYAGVSVGVGCGCCIPPPLLPLEVFMLCVCVLLAVYVGLYAGVLLVFMMSPMLQ